LRDDRQIAADDDVDVRLAAEDLPRLGSVAERQRFVRHLEHSGRQLAEEMTSRPDQGCRWPACAIIVPMLPSAFPELKGPQRASLRRLCREYFDMQIEDVRVVLRMPKAGFPAECNFATIAVLFNLIAGASVCFYDASPKALATPGDRGKRFKDMLITFPPLTAPTASHAGGAGRSTATA
jgi:hypothetical protein